MDRVGQFNSLKYKGIGQWMEVAQNTATLQNITS